MQWWNIKSLVSKDIWVLRLLDVGEVVGTITFDVHRVINFTVFVLRILVVDDEVRHVLFRSVLVYSLVSCLWNNHILIFVSKGLLIHLTFTNIAIPLIL